MCDFRLPKGCSDEEKTLTSLVDDWDRYQRANPGKSSVVLARTRAEVRALSHLMRERRFAALPDGERADAGRVTVIVSRGTEDERTTSPLEIVRGDQLRIGATHWEKQLFNGTVVTVEDFKVEKAEAGKEPSVLISARTEDGRAVSFHHDEIRDWYGNIRLDHGYALTITSAQGLTVDRTFLLADAAKPDWYAPYEALRQDWNSLIEDARQAGIPLFYANGYIDIIPRIRGLMENPDIPAKSRAPLMQVLENHQRYLSTRKHILDYPGEAERHMDARAPLQDVADDQEIGLTGVPAYADWRQEAERLRAADDAILSGKKTNGAHLDRIVDAKTHMIRALSELREAIRDDDKELAERKARELRRQRFLHLAGPRFAPDDGVAPEPARAMSTSAAPVRAALSRLGRAIGHLVGGQDYHVRT